MYAAYLVLIDGVTGRNVYVIFYQLLSIVIKVPNL